MDLRLFGRVLWRFKLLIAVGVLVASALAVVSFVRVGPNGLQYRQTELWSSSTRLLVTQQGFPWGRLLALDPSLDPAVEARRLGIPLADPNRLNTLTILYAELATSDPVRRLLRRNGPIRGKILATPVVVQDGRYTLPLIDLTAIATSRRRAMTLAEQSATAFRTYLTEQQRANEVPDADRVVVQEVVRPRRAEIYRGRSQTMPLVIFLAVLFASVGLAFLLENARPRVPPGESAELEVEQAQYPRTA